MKKSLGILRSVFCVLIAGLLLAGCVGPTDNPGKHTDDPNSPTAEPTEEPAPDWDKYVYTDTLPKKDPEPETHFHFDTEGTGFDVFAPLDGKWGYRYAPSILYYPDGTMDAWFATPGTTGEWDWITYKHSDDKGVTWTDEKIVLTPTPDSYDHYSVCDPGAIFFNGYFYLGYTSTIVSTNGGINNNVFVSRSKNPDGPYEKWNGSGWGGDPAPIVYFDDADNYWGAGEPSFVVVDDTLYIYYTWMGEGGSFKYVSTADATQENWPATMQFKGRAFTSSDGDQVDVCYVEDAGLFLGVQTCNRFTANSGILFWESKDGIHFVRGEFNSTNIAKFCHNMGISKRADGHVQLGDKLMLGYAYASGGSDSGFWGKWATRFVDIKLSTYTGSVDKKDKGKNGILITDYFWPAPTDNKPVGITTLPHLVQISEGATANDFTVYWIDSAIAQHEIKDVSKLTFTDYDNTVVSIENGKIKGLKAGKTNCTVSYEGHSVTFKIYVYEKGFKFAQKTPEIESIRAVNPEITVYKGKANGATHKTQIRAYVRFADDSWGEAYNDSTGAHPTYPAMVPYEDYEMGFTSADETIVKVSKAGVITAKSVGTTTVKVTMNGKDAFEVTVHVVEPPAEYNWKDADFKW